MLSDVLQARIREYAPANAVEQENMLAELMQHYVLASLSRSGRVGIRSSNRLMT